MTSVRRQAPPDGPAVYAVLGRVEQTPGGTAWLTPQERMVEAGLVVPKRRTDWRLGRWLAKRAVIECLGDQPDDILLSQVEVTAGPDGAPEVRVHSGAGVVPLSISISHSEGVGMAVAASGSVALGCDVERVAPRSDRFVRDYLTEEEREGLNGMPTALRSSAVTLMWSAKEAALKVLREGLRMDTRAVVVELPDAVRNELPPSGHWSTVRVQVMDGEWLEGHWRAADGFMWTIVGDRELRLASPSPPPFRFRRLTTPPRIPSAR